MEVIAIFIGLRQTLKNLIARVALEIYIGLNNLGVACNICKISKSSS